MYSNNRDAYRQQFYAAWEKFQHQLALSPIEAQIVAAITAHPEYHDFLANKDRELHTNFDVEENPFVHLSLHISVSEQIKLNRPAGITAIFQQLSTELNDHHAAEHAIMTTLGKMMWQAQQSGEPPQETDYLLALRQLLST